MAIPTPITFATGDQALADYQSGIEDVLTWLMSDRPAAIQTITSVSLTQSVFTQGDAWTATEDGLYLAFVSVRCSSVKGNKELRLTTDGQYDDADPWIASANQFGVATAAYSSLSVAGLVDCAAGTDIEYGVFVDTPDTVQIDRGTFGVIWLRNRL